MFCKNCGLKLPEGMRFCKECGTEVKQQIPTDKDKGIDAGAISAFLKEEKAEIVPTKCIKCGSDLKPDDRFCKECGFDTQSKVDKLIGTSIEAEVILPVVESVELSQPETSNEAIVVENTGEMPIAFSIENETQEYSEESMQESTVITCTDDTTEKTIDQETELNKDSAQNQPDKRKSKNKLSLIIVSVIATVCVILGVYFVPKIMDKKDPKSDEKELEIVIPDVIGMKSDEAISLLQASGLNITYYYETTDLSEKDKIVFSINPSAGEKLNKGEYVTLSTYKYEHVYKYTGYFEITWSDKKPSDCFLLTKPRRPKTGDDSIVKKSNGKYGNIKKGTVFSVYEIVKSEDKKEYYANTEYYYVVDYKGKKYYVLTEYGEFRVQPHD